jgi:hypothetical protein
MITLEDCIGLCGLTEEEVLAVAEHEHLPEVVATALAQYLLSREHGSEDIRDMIVEDIRQAQWSGNKEHVLTLLHVLHHFPLTHPEARPSEHPWSHPFLENVRVGGKPKQGPATRGSCRAQRQGQRRPWRARERS